MKKEFRVGIFDRLQDSIHSFTFVEKTLFYGFSVLLVISAVLILAKLNDFFLVEVPARGGSITEGIIGTPRFINPLLASTDADRDLTQLVYAGLMKPEPHGTLSYELADHHTISDDGLIYTFTLRDDAKFHDGKPVTAHDVVYTIELAQNPDTKSPKRANWEGVRVELVDEQTVRFTLSEPYAPFLENMTLGILPQNLWDETTSAQLPFSPLNAEPIGAGPFKIVSLERTRAGVPTQYKLVSYSGYVLNEPYIEGITFRFYPNEEELIGALERGSIDSAYAISPKSAIGIEANNHDTVHTSPLPRIFGVFFNQNEAPVFTNIEVRKALDVSINRKAILDEALAGFGKAISGPLPPGILPEKDEPTSMDPVTEGQAVLQRNGWEFDETDGVYKKKTKEETYTLSFSISTVNTPELKQVAEILAQSWRDLGAHVELKLFDTGSLNNSVIRPRGYEALLFGQIIGRAIDPFAFWHSSQRNDPGLNIALYANITTDNILEKIRSTFDVDERSRLYGEFDKEIREETPAIFIYAPDFIYVTQKSLRGVELGTVTTPAERFLSVHKWHLKTDKVWPIFN